MTIASRLLAPLLAICAIGCMGAAAASDPAAPAEISLVKQGQGWLITDAKGMTLYTFTKDQEPGKSACNAACAQVWPAVVAPADAKPSADWSIVTREDGVHQWAFRGKPLYTYSKDLAPHDSYGDDLNRQWVVALMPIPTPPGIDINRTLAGHVLSNAKSMTLYMSDKDTASKSACDAACSRTWIPVEMPWMSSPIDADWSGVLRADGTKQWAYKGKPLYAYLGDVNAGETSGDGVDKTWHALVLQPPPPLPPWVSVQESDAGELFADASGHTIYMHDNGRRRAFGGPALDMERPQDWKPVVAAADAIAVGNWSIMTDKDGSRQWSYKGLLLFTNVWDANPGDLHGIRSTDRSWHTIMRSGQPMQGTGA